MRHCDTDEPCQYCGGSSLHLTNDYPGLKQVPKCCVIEFNARTQTTARCIDAGLWGVLRVETVRHEAFYRPTYDPVDGHLCMRHAVKECLHLNKTERQQVSAGLGRLMEALRGSA